MSLHDRWLDQGHDEAWDDEYDPDAAAEARAEQIIAEREMAERDRDEWP